jgi:beta-galactosidase
MNHWTRRDLFKAGIAASAAAAGQGAANSQSQPEQAAGGAGRERLLLDFGWRFHLGHAGDAAKDFDFGADAGTFAKSGGFVAPADAKFDDSSWQKVDLPHDWAIELPFENARALTDHGSYPLGRNYPATSIGWYRRVFDLPAADAGKRIALEFDGVFRNSIIVFNGHYLDTVVSGYAPFRFDVTDLAAFGG